MHEVQESDEVDGVNEVTGTGPSLADFRIQVLRVISEIHEVADTGPCLADCIIQVLYVLDVNLIFSSVLLVLLPI